MSLRPSHPHPLTLATGAPSASPVCGQLLETMDWTATALGGTDNWPLSLRIAVSICLNSRFPMFVWWGPSLVNIYNDAYIPILGKRHPTAFGRPAQQTWHEIWDVVGPQNEAVMTRGEATWNERVVLMMERNGYLEETYFTWSYSPIYLENGRVGGMFCACTEETAHVAAERERDRLMAQAQDTARTLQEWFNNAPGFVALLRGPDHVFELVNSAYLQLVGHRDVLGRPLAEAIPEIRDQPFLGILDRVIATGEPFIGHAVPAMLQRVPGAPLIERFVDLVYQPLVDPEGKVRGIFVQGHDVTEQVHATLALKEADQRKDEFLATLAHELRNPLAPLRHASMLVGSDRISPERRAKALAVIDRQLRHMTLLIDDLLDVSRISQGKLEIRPREVDLQNVVAAAVETATPALEKKGHRLHLVLPQEPLRVTVDPLRIAQVLANLLSNAAKYTDPDGEIELRADADTAAGEVVLRVRDNGIGLTPADSERIFGMFSQVRSALDRSEGGLGIGLALSRGLVNLHGGRIEVRSPGLGQGSEFTVHLPVKAVLRNVS